MKLSNIFVLAIIFVLASTAMSFAQSEGNTKTIEVKVKGVTCSSDLKTLSANVEKLKGVTACKADKAGATSKFKVTYNPALVTEKDIRKAIEGTPGCDNPDARPYKVKQ